MEPRNVGLGVNYIWAFVVNTHDVISAEVSLINVGDNGVLSTLLNPLHRKVHSVSADGAYDTKKVA